MIEIKPDEEDFEDLNQFIDERKSELDTFKRNMELYFPDLKKTKEGWMEYFLDWEDWKTDMHDMVWKNIF